MEHITNAEFNFSSIRIIKDPLYEPLPDYIPPEKTGDELADEISELISYRNHQQLKRDREMALEKLRLRYMHIVKVKKEQMML